MPVVDAILKEFQQELTTTRRVLERVPGDKLGWEPHPKSMSLGELAMHVAQTPGAVAGMVSRPSLDLKGGFAQESAKSAQELLATLDASAATVTQVLGAMDDAAAAATWTMTAGGRTILSAPRAAVLRMLMLNHWYHHRGQLSVYLRELDVPLPSIYGPTADENPFA